MLCSLFTIQLLNTVHLVGKSWSYCVRLQNRMQVGKRHTNLCCKLTAFFNKLAPKCQLIITPVLLPSVLMLQDRSSEYVLSTSVISYKIKPNKTKLTEHEVARLVSVCSKKCKAAQCTIQMGAIANCSPKIFSTKCTDNLQSCCLRCIWGCLCQI